MGLVKKLVNKVFNNNKKAVNTPPVQHQTNPYEFQMFSAEGGIFIEMIDNTYEVGKYYDTTRIFIPNESTIINNQALKECLVSWYGQIAYFLVKMVKN